MDQKILQEEKGKLSSILETIKSGKKHLESSMEVMGAENLNTLKELRENPETNGMDFFVFLETLHEKNQSFNFKDKYKRLEEYEYLLREPYFSRIDFIEQGHSIETYYIGKFGYTDKLPIVTDWRTKIASLYYRYRYPQKNVHYDSPDGAIAGDLALKRTYEIDDGAMIKYYNNDIQLDESEIISEKISKRTGGVLEDIIETIQVSQLDIIESDPRQICIVQGCVGSGKSTVAIHKLSHIFFNYPAYINPERSILIAKNQILVGYLSTLFPKLGIFDINYKSLRELFYNLIFREELKLNVDFDLDTDVSTFGLEQINEVRAEIGKIHQGIEAEIDAVFAVKEFENFGGYKYNPKTTVAENLTELIEEMEEEIELQKGYLEENPNGAKAWFFKENIKVLHKIISALKKLRLKLKETILNTIAKSLNININTKLGYLDTLKYLFIYSELVGITKFPKFEYCVVDEGQDFGILEYLVLSKIVLNGRFCILGDLNQGFTAEGIASWDQIAEVIKDAKNAKVFSLDTNYRSTKPIIDLANSILQKHTDKYLPKSINRRGSEPIIANFASVDAMMKEFTKEVHKDLNPLEKSIGIICYDENIKTAVEKIIKDNKVPTEQFIKLNSKTRISYIPKGVYLMDFDDCKGLEFAKVYVLGLNLEETKDFIKAKRAFVAVTRAMNELHVYGCH